MTTFKIGCAGFARPRDQYIRRLAYVEFDLRPPVPSPKVLASWKKQRPENFTYGVVAPAALYGERDWPLRDANRVQAELDRLANNLDAIGAGALVLRTPMAVSPGSVALKRFLPVLERARKVSPLVVWDPAGLWERDEAVTVAEEYGAVVACDPLHADVSDESLIYARLRGLGVDRDYSPERLEDLLERVSHADAAWVVFDSANAWRDAVRFTALVSGVEVEPGDDDEADEDDEDEYEDEDGDDEEVEE